jgi:hypothetical protein
MRAIIALVTGAAALGIVPIAGAQQKEKSKEPSKVRVLTPSKDECVTTDGRTECRLTRRLDLDSALMKRPAIGVQLSPTGTARDTLGVFVSRVTPKGPAENAGIVEGDRLVSINGVDLRVNAADAGDDYAAGLPSRRVTREVGKLTPGSVANVRVYSGGRVRDVQVTVGRASDLHERGMFGMMMDGEGMNGFSRMGPALENMRIQLRDMPRMRYEDMPRMRMDMMPRMKMEMMPRIRIERDGPGSVWIERSDSAKEKAKVEVEKEKSGKKKN